jgi:hypothetical protein
MMTMWFKLDDPPTPEQINRWARIRTNRRQYLLIGALHFTLFLSGMLVLAACILYWTGLKDSIDIWPATPLVPVGPIAGWIAGRQAWFTNEKRYP